MSYLVFHLSKYKSSNIIGLQRHNQRENRNYSNKDIDTTMSDLNYDLVNSENISFTKKVNSIIDSKRTTKKAIRRDAVTYCECIISSDNDFFRNLDIKGVSSGKCGFTTLSQYLYFSINRVYSIDTPLKTR